MNVCLPDTKKFHDLADNIVGSSDSVKNFNALQELVQYVMDLHAEKTGRTFDGYDHDELNKFADLLLDNEKELAIAKESFKEVLLAYKQLDLVDFSVARRIVNNKQVNTSDYLNFINNNKIITHNRTDANGNPKDLDDIKIQLMIRINRGNVPASYTASLGYNYKQPAKQKNKLNIKIHNGFWSRSEAQNNPNILYVFTDNIDRDSGSGNIPDDSWYAKKYGIGHHYPTATAAVVRGLDNARPISTMHYFYKIHGFTHPVYNRDSKALWHDSDVEEFKEIIRSELQDIVDAFNAGKYDTIMFPNGDGLFNTSISNITKERTPVIYQALVDLLREYGFDSLIPQDIQGSSYYKDSINLTKYFEALPEVQKQSVPTATTESKSVEELKKYDSSKVVSTKNYSIQIDDLRYSMDPKVREDAVDLIARDYYSRITSLINKSEDYIRKEAEKRNVSYEAMKVYQQRINNERFEQIEYESKQKNPNQDFLKEWNSKIYPLTELDVIRKYGNDLFKRVMKNTFMSNQKTRDIANNFDVLFNEAASVINKTYGINITGNTATFDEDEDLDNTSNPEDTEINIDTQREDFSSADDKTRSTERSLSKELKLLYTRCWQTYQNNKIMKDSFGFNKPVGISVAHNKILHLLEGIIDADDIVPYLQRSSEPWIKQVISAINKNPLLKNQLYNVYKVSAQNYITVYYDKKRGYTFKSNNKLGYAELIQKETAANISSGNIQGIKKISVFNNQGKYNLEGIENLKNFADELRKKISNVNNLEDIPDFDNDFLNMFRGLGITIPNNYNLTEALALANTTPRSAAIEQATNVSNACTYLKKHYEEFNNPDISLEDKVTDTTYENAFKFLGKSDIGFIESVVTEGGKNYYTYAKTNFLDELILKLKRKSNNSEKLKRDENGKNFFDKYLDRRFGQSDFFKNPLNNRWRSDWLAKLVDPKAENNKFREIFERMQILASSVQGRKLEYVDWDYGTSVATNFLMYQQAEQRQLGDNLGVGIYRMTIASDSPAGDYVKFVKYTSNKERSYDDIITDHLYDVVLQEAVRMRDVEEHLNNNIKSGNFDEGNIKSYDAIFKDGKLKEAGGLVFTMLPQLNYIRINTEDPRYTIFQKAPELIQELNNATFLEAFRKIVSTMKTNKNISNSDLKTFFKTVYLDWFEEDFNREFDEIKQYLIPLYFKKGTDLDITIPEATLNQMKKDYREYSMNYQYAYTQLVELTCTDMAFYGKRTIEKTNNKAESHFSIKLPDGTIQYYKITGDSALEDFQKRNKEYHAPTNKGAFSKPYQRVAILKDIKMRSEILTNVESIINNNKNLSPDYKKTVLGIWREQTNVTDGQSIRSLSSYRDTLVAMGKLDSERLEVFDRVIAGLQSGNVVFDAGDLNIIALAIKPYVYTVRPVTRDTKDKSGNPYITMVPTQFKNSELPLFAALGAMSVELNKSNALSALQKFMAKHNIDVIHFDSVVKVGLSGAAEFDTNLSESDILKDLEHKFKFDSSEKGDPNMVYDIPNEDWGEQTIVPDHWVDTVQLMGSQPRRLVLADIPEDPDYTITINGKPYNREGFLDHYQELISQNILDAFEEVDSMFKDPELLSKFLRESVASSVKYDDDLIEMFVWNPERKAFNLPLFDQTTANRVEELLNALIRDRIVKQKIAGGALVQTAAVGLTKRLNIRYKNANGELIDTEDVWMSKHEGSTREDYYDWFTKQKATLAYAEVILPIWAEEMKEWLIDDNGNVHFEWLPDELKYMVGYRVPTEDHYSMLPMKVVGFNAIGSASQIILPADITTIAGSDFDIDKLYVMRHEFRINKLDYEKLKEDYEALKKSDKETKEAVDKLLGDIFKDYDNIDEEKLEQEFPDFARWVNMHKYDTYEEESNKIKYLYIKPKTQWTAKKIKYNTDKTPAENSRKARNNEIVDSMFACLTSPHSLEKFTNPGNFVEEKKASRICEIASDTKNNLTYDELVAMKLEELNAMISDIHKEKNISSPKTASDLHQQNMTGKKLVGIFAVAGAIQQIMEYSKMKVNVWFSINDNKSNPNFIIGDQRKNQKLITKQMASYLAAAVDNGKDPIMKALNINPDNARIVVLLSLLGYSPLEIGLFFDVNYSSIQSFPKEYKFTELEKGYINGLESSKAVEVLSGKVDLNYAMAYATMVRNTFKRVDKLSSLFGHLTRIYRADSTNGNVGKSVFQNVRYLFDYESFVELNKHLEKDSNGNYVTKYYFSDPSSEEKEPKLAIAEFTKDPIDIKARVSSAKVKYLQAFTDAGIVSSYTWLKPYSLMLNDTVYEFIDRLKTPDGYLNERVVKKFLDDLQAYWLLSNNLWGDDGNMSISQRRDYYINQFPYEFKEFQDDLPEELRDNTFIHNIIFQKQSRWDKKPHLIVKDLGDGKSVRAMFKTDFDKLAKVNPQMAIKLFVYSTFRNGFSFSPEGWAHLVSSRFKMSLKDYSEDLQKMTEIAGLGDFYEMFLRNNYRTFYYLVPKKTFVDTKAENAFKDVLKNKSIDTKSDLPESAASVNYFTYEGKLYAEYYDSNNELLAYMHLTPLGKYKLYHEYDHFGGITMFEQSYNLDPDNQTEDDSIPFEDKNKEYSKKELDSTLSNSEVTNNNTSENQTDQSEVQETNDFSTNAEGIQQCVTG